MHFLVRRAVDPFISQKLGASDIVQEGMVRIHRGIEQFRGESVPELLTWIRIIIVTAASDLADKAFADKRDVRREVHGSSLLKIIAARSSAGQRAVRHEAAVELANAIDRLDNQRYRKALMLGIVDGCSRAEAAEQMGISAAAFRVLLFRALRKLRGDEQLMAVVGEGV